MKEKIARTHNMDGIINGLITLFDFLPALHSRQICNGCWHPDTQPRCATLGKARIGPQFKTCTVTDFWLQDSLYPMTLSAGWRIGQGLKRVMLNKICTVTAKSAPSASWRNTTSPYRRTVSG